MRCLALLAPLLLLTLPAVADGLKDPTRPPVVVAAAAHPKPRPVLPRVSAIFVSNDRRVAIVDDQPVRVGDSVGIYHIDEINAGGVRYSASGHSAFAALGAQE